MKKIFLSLVACLLVGVMFTSCEKNNTSVNSIVGKWQMIHLAIYIDGELDEEEQVSEGSGTIWEFLKNGTGVESYPDPDHNSSYGVNFTWEIEGSTLTMNYPEHDQLRIYTIKSVTDNLLTLEYSEVRDGNTYLYIHTFKNLSASSEGGSSLDKSAIVGTWKTENAQHCYYENGQLVRTEDEFIGEVEQYWEFQTGGVLILLEFAEGELYSDTTTWKLSDSILTTREGTVQEAQFRVNKLTQAQLQIETDYYRHKTVISDPEYEAFRYNCSKVK